MKGKVIKAERRNNKVMNVRDDVLVSHQNPKRGGKSKNG